ncbi:TIGR03089 family protein [uncultured Cellulomonas sp.]|uniref:TIGR03089 family protein n=1 Tax=uncultured Cellulomonas sp. TaxID=189682 RepID=UPI0028EEB70A|nr:TIGR03089 family protein [uncultured Cellulomonas sp.]
MPPTTVQSLLTSLVREPGRPRLTWYGDDHERVELSGAVLENWVNKTTNLLVEEFDAQAGVRVALDLPGHWRTVVWALAVWRTGACVVPPGDAATDVVVTDRPAEVVGSPHVVAVALPALARRFPEPLPAGATDAAGAVMTYGDVVGWTAAVDPSALALDADVVRTHADLLRGAAPAPHRVLVPAPERADAVAFLLDVLAVLEGDGSVVATSPEVTAELRSDAPRLARLVASERITAGALVDEG